MDVQRKRFITANTTRSQRPRRHRGRGTIVDRVLQARFFVEGRIGGKAALVSFRCQEGSTIAASARSRRVRCDRVVFAVMNLSTRANRADGRSSRRRSVSRGDGHRARLHRPCDRPRPPDGDPGRSCASRPGRWRLPCGRSRADVRDPWRRSPVWRRRRLDGTDLEPWEGPFMAAMAVPGMNPRHRFRFRVGASAIVNESRGLEGLRACGPSRPDHACAAAFRVRLPHFFNRAGRTHDRSGRRVRKVRTRAGRSASRAWRRPKQRDCCAARPRRSRSVRGRVRR